MSDQVSRAQSRRFRFSLRDVLLAVTLIAVGLGGLVAVLRKEWPVDYIISPVMGWYGSAALIGAGLFTPFKRKALGSVAGLFLAWIFVFEILKLYGFLGR